MPTKRKKKNKKKQTFRYCFRDVNLNVKSVYNNYYIPTPTERGYIDFGADSDGDGVTVTLSCLHNILWTRDWILTEFSWMYVLYITRN